MSEEYETERHLDRDGIAGVLEDFADGLHGDGEVTLAVGGEHVRIDPPETCEFEVEVEEEAARFGAAERSVEFEIKWNRRDAERNLVD